MSCGRLLGEEPETGVNDELAVVRGEREVGRRRGVMRNILWAYTTPPPYLPFPPNHRELVIHAGLGFLTQ